MICFPFSFFFLSLFILFPYFFFPFSSLPVLMEAPTQYL